MVTRSRSPSRSQSANAAPIGRTVQESGLNFALAAPPPGLQVKLLRVLQDQSFEHVGGVKRIHLINGLREDALYKEIYESVSPGTMVLPEEERQNYLNEVEVQKLIEARK